MYDAMSDSDKCYKKKRKRERAKRLKLLVRAVSLDCNVRVSFSEERTYDLNRERAFRLLGRL